MTFSITVTPSGVTRITIEGQLDRVTVLSLKPEIDKLLATKPRRVEIDLAALNMIDSAGVGSLVSLYKSVRASGGEVLATGLHDQPLAIFKLLRLEHVMTGSGSNPPKSRP
jgi:anti-sigma B factor antagonist